MVHLHLPAHVSSLQELLQAKQDLQDLLIAKEEQEDLLRKRERELTALKGALKEEVSSHDQEMEKLKEQYDAELQALRESVEEATKVSAPGCRPAHSECQEGRGSVAQEQLTGQLCPMALPAVFCFVTSGKQNLFTENNSNCAAVDCVKSKNLKIIQDDV